MNSTRHDSNSAIAYYNGAFLDKKEIHIDPDDRGFLFADGIYEVIRAYNGRFFRIGDHIRRLHYGAEAMRFDRQQIPDLSDIAGELLSRNGLTHDCDAIIYLQITRGAAPRGHAFPAPETPLTVYAYARRFESNLNEQNKGVKAITVPDQRWARCDIKSIALLPNILANQKAHESGAKEAIFIRDGVVQECSHSNIFLMQNGIVKTPPLSNFVLAGVTRQSVLDLCKEQALETQETPVFLDDLFFADEVSIAGTTLEITPVFEIDGKPIGNGPGRITQKLQKAFRKSIRE